jgi:hypothetical protein
LLLFAAESSSGVETAPEIAFSYRTSARVEELPASAPPRRTLRQRAMGFVCFVAGGHLPMCLKHEGFHLFDFAGEGTCTIACSVCAMPLGADGFEKEERS